MFCLIILINVFFLVIEFLFIFMGMDLMARGNGVGDNEGAAVYSSR